MVSENYKWYTVCRYNKNDWITYREKKWNRKEKQFYKLILKSVGVKKVRTIKLVRKVTNCGLRAAKAFIDCPPKLITGGLLLEDAEKLQKQFSDLGNTVVIEEER